MKVKLQTTGPVKISSSYNPYYATWYDMMRRCYNSKRSNYKYYGARGIKVCDRWHDFRNFAEDMGAKPEGYTLDRKDNEGNYSPENCKWSSLSEQASNKRGYTNTGHKGIRFNHGKFEAWSGYKYLGRFTNLENALAVKNEA